MSRKFIPNGDHDFVVMAEAFARNIVADPARFEVSQGDTDELASSVKEYRAALQACGSGGRSAVATREKEEARADAEQIIRRLAHVIRANDKINAAAKVLLHLRERTAKAKPLTCPQEPPRMRFLRALHEGSGATPMHELEFKAFDWTSAKPPGAVRLELFVDLVPLDEPIPNHPGSNHSSRPWYLRSYTRSPIVLVPPLARVPMRVVYWGRWADSTGSVGPFCATVVGWVEGGSHQWLAPVLDFHRKPVPILEDATAPGPATREATITVAVIEAQYQTFHPQNIAPALNAPERPTLRIEGPRESEAA